MNGMENDVAERHTDTLLSSSDGIMTHPLEKKIHSWKFESFAGHH